MTDFFRKRKSRGVDEKVLSQTKCICPTYVFDTQMVHLNSGDSSNKTTRLENWKTFEGSLERGGWKVV